MPPAPSTAAYPSQQSPVQSYMVANAANQLQHQQSLPQAVPTCGSIYVYPHQAPIYQPHHSFPVNRSDDMNRSPMTAGYVCYMPSPPGPVVSQSVHGPSGQIPVWTAAAAGGIPITTVGQYDVPFAADGVATTENDGTPIVMQVPPGSAVDMPAMGYGGHQSVFMYPPPQDYQHQQPLVQVMQSSQQPQHHLQHVATQPVVNPIGISHQSGNPLINSTNMEFVWHGSFNDSFQSFFIQYKDCWQLAPLGSHEDPRELASVPSVKTFKDSAKVRFLCKECGNAWTSMKGRVIFWIILQRHMMTTNQGIGGYGSVRFKLFGQRCQKCNNEQYQDPMWYPEEVMKVVKNVYNRVGQLYYGFKWPTTDATRRTGRPRTQHNASYCQACAEGICNENRDEGGVIDVVVNGLAKLTVHQAPPALSVAQPPYLGQSQPIFIAGLQTPSPQQLSAASSPTNVDR